MFSEKVVYFAGDGQSGKTSLAKHLFNCALQRGLLPVYIKGERLKDSSARALQSMLRKKFESQYSHPSFDKFLQMPANSKVAIIDDLPDSSLNRRAKAKAIEWLRSRCDYVFVFGGDFSHVEEMLADMEDGQLVPEMAHFELVELGYVLRSRLIEKWITLGATSNHDRESLAHKVSEVERLIDTVLGKNLLPAYPIFILSMLQQLEADTAVSTKSGAYGYLYEILITTALNKTSRSVDEIDTKYTYLSEVAWYLRCQKARECDREEMDQFNERHRTSYRLTQAPTQLLQDVIESRILVQHGSRVGFRYKYLYYYFLARYIRDNISEPDTTSAVDECVRDLHREECANVIIFLTYLSKDRAIIQKLLDCARDIFRDVPPCDLESHVEFLNKLDSAIPKILLPDSDPATAKEEVLRQKDLQHQSRRQSSDTSGLSEEHEPEELNQVLTLNRAMKSIQIMGQILRNFAGSIKGPIKKDLASECFAVGLRTLNAYYRLLEKHLEAMIDIFADIFEKNLYDIEPKKRILLGNRFIFVLTEMLCLGIVKRISNAVGSEKLLPTFEDVEESMKSLAAEFVQVGIRMDHGAQFPEKRVLDIHKRLAGNHFGQNLLSMMVANHFYLFPRNYRVRQRICEKLGIVQSKKMLIATSERKSRD